MTDQCRMCKGYENIAACLSFECQHHDNWYARVQTEKIERLENIVAQRGKELEAMWRVLNKVSTTFDRGLHLYDFQIFSEIFDAADKVKCDE